MNKIKQLSDEAVNRIVRMGWEDRTTFDHIEKVSGLSEAEVIKVMRRELKPRSFRLWRKRVTGRITKHRKPLKRHLNPPISTVS
jgi:uncharacterized protein (TIGR03643 family)